VTRPVAIHQPNFFPWLGYFDKIRRVDVFVVLDTVQHQKTGGTWSNRVKLNVGGEARWAIAPTVRNYHGVKRISDIEFDESTPWREKLIKTLETSYGRAPYFAEAMGLLQALVLNPERQMCVYNMHAIRVLVDALVEPAPELVFASELSAEGNATDLLIALVRAVGGDTYLSGGGAGGYQDPAKFEQAGVRLVFQNFHHPVYPQHASEGFIAGLSIADALFNCGLGGTRQLLRQAV
jgi:WbqC-like protein family